VIEVPHHAESVRTACLQLELQLRRSDERKPGLVVPLLCLRCSAVTGCYLSCVATRSETA
jgi:hypothetical protein